MQKNKLLLAQWDSSFFAGMLVERAIGLAEFNVIC